MRENQKLWNKRNKIITIVRKLGCVMILGSLCRALLKLMIFFLSAIQ